MAESLLRERLSGATRTRRDAELVDPLAPEREPVPGKQRSSRRANVRRQGARIDRRATDDREPDDLDSALALIGESGGGQALPRELAARLGAQLGIDTGKVRIHDHPRAHEAAEQLRARAFTIGDDVYFAAGAYDPTTDAGIELIAHELAHVAQQRNTTPTSQPRVSSPEDSHEHEADEFAKSFRATPDVGEDPASVVEYARHEARRINLPFQAELEEQLGTSFDHVQAFSGEAAQIACEALGASAFVIRNLVMLADPSPQRELLLHELTHVQQMAKQHASSEFALGSLRVSRPDDAAEVEARSHQAATVAADPNTIYRKTATDGDSEEDTPSARDERIELWLKNAPRETFPQGKKGEEAYAFADPKSGDRYEDSSPKPWNRDDYAAVLNANKKLKRSARTYTADIAEMTKPENKEKYRIANVTDFTWAFIHDGTWVPKVKDVRPDARKPPDPEDQFACYFRVVKYLTDKKRIKDFEYADSVKTYKSKTYAVTPEGADKYREAMRTAIVDGYTSGKKGKEKSWELFYKEVMKGKGPDGARLVPAKFNGLTGSIFEELVKATLGVTLEKERPLFSDPSRLKKDPRMGDAAAFGKKGNVIIDDKASEAGIDLEQCEDYAAITDPDDPIPGYFASDPQDEDPKHIYTAVAYAVPSKKLADKVKGQIDNLFGAKKALIWKRFHVSPDPSGLKSFLLKFNPEIMLQTADTGGPRYVFSEPPSGLSGVTFKKITVDTDGSGNVKGGDVDMSIDMHGAIKNERIKDKPIKPGNNGVAGGTVENKFGGFKSTLDKVLGAVEVDAKLVPGGVEGTIALKAGKAKIPSFEVNEAKLTAKYINDNLSVDGEVELTHKSKNVGGTVKVGWDGVAWTLDGNLKLKDGLVPGLTDASLGIRYAGGKTTIYCPHAKYNKKIGAVDLTGDVSDLEYDFDTGGFSGNVELKADMGMFGSASASGRIEKNKLKSATFSYDSPELKYPAKSEKPSLSGSVGGTIRYEDGKFSGAIRGTADINVAGLKKVAGDKGLGLDVDAHLNADGTYGGTVRTTTPLQFGDHIRIPHISATIADDSSITGTFELQITKIKWIDDCSIKCSIDKDGVTIENFHAEKTFGNEEKNKFWGQLTVNYEKEKGLEIGGKVNYKIKDGMIATGDLKFSTENYKASLELEVSEITLLDAKSDKKTLFKIQKQIPVVNVYGIGIYIDIGFDLTFDMGFHLGLKPKVDFVDFSLQTGEFKEIKAKLELLGQLYAQLTGTPKIGIGVFVLDPSLLRGGGGLMMPIVGRAEINPKGSVELAYSGKGDVSGDAKFDMAMVFGIKASLVPYADFDVLSGLWNPSWTGQALTEFTILEPKELFSMSVDLGGDMTKKTEAPPMPAENAAPPAREGANDDKFKQQDTKAPEEKPESDKTKEGPKQEVKENGDEGPFSLASLLPQLRAIPGVETAEKVMRIAKKAWKYIEPIYDLVKPLIDLIGKRIDAFIDLFDTELPTSLEDAIPWVWKLAKKVFNVAFGGLTDLVEAIWTMLGQAIDFAKKLIDKAVQKGWIGVKRHSYYIWRPWPWDDYNFLAASEYKVNIPNVLSLGREGPDSTLLTPDSAIALGLYQVLKRTSDYTYTGPSDIGDPFNDFWVGTGSR